MPAPKLAADFRPRVERLLSAFDRDVESESGRRLVQQAVAFAELVASWNDRIDLTAARDADELVDLLFADAVALLRDRDTPAGERWLDVGSGMGAPGVAIALLAPDACMTLVEPRAKRVAFLRTLLHTLGRSDIGVERSRAETLPDGSCDVAVSRATLRPSEWLREGARLACAEVWVLLARESPPQTPGWEIIRSNEFVWPLTAKARRVVAYRRCRPTGGQNSNVNER